jgi:hypothetical protein
MIISQVDSIRDRGTMMASHTAQEFQIPVLLSYFFFMENNKLLEVIPEKTMHFVTNTM